MRRALVPVGGAAHGSRRPRGRLRGSGRGSWLLGAGHVLAALDLAAQPLLPLLADLAAVPLRDGRVLPGDAHHLCLLMRLEKVPPPLVAAESHPLDLARFEGVHRDAPDEGDVHAEASMHAGARQADKDAKLGGCPLRGWRIAVAAEVVLGFLLEGGKLG